MKRRIHVDQGRRATNVVHAQDNDIVSVADEAGNIIMWGGTIQLLCPCGEHVASVIQPKADQAHIAVAPSTSLVAFANERTENPTFVRLIPPAPSSYKELCEGLEDHEEYD